MEASEWDSVKWKRVESRVSQMPERRKEKEGERVSCGVWRQWLVEAGLEPEASAWYENRQSSVWQPSLRFNSAGKELLPPTQKKKNLHSHLLPLLLHASPYPSHTPFHSPTASPFTQRHFQTDQMGSVKHTPLSAAIDITVMLPASWAALFPSTVLLKWLLQNQLGTGSLWAGLTVWGNVWLIKGKKSNTSQVRSVRACWVLAFKNIYYQA